MSKAHKTPFQGFSSRRVRHEVVTLAALPEGENV